MVERGPFRRRRGHDGGMSRPLEIFALAPDAWGGRGGIAQYNRDFLGALSRCPDVQSVTVMVREEIDRANPPAGVEQIRTRPHPIIYALICMGVALGRRVDVVICGHVNMAPLGLAIAR